MNFVCEMRCINLNEALNAILCKTDHVKKCYSFVSEAFLTFPADVQEIIKNQCDWANVSYLAAESNNQTIILQLVQQNTIDWKSSLDGACAGGHLELIKYLLSLGSTITSTTLIFAGKRRDILQYLFPYVNNSHFSHFRVIECFLHILFKSKLGDLATMFMEKFDSTLLAQCFILACHKDYKDLTRAIVGKGVLSSRDMERGLIISCVREQVDIISFLIENGAKNT